MSDFVSWYEKRTGDKTEILFLTGEMLTTPDGERMAKEMRGDIRGHSAIRRYFQFDIESRNGNLPDRTSIYTERESTDFYSPDSFPNEIASAIKSGKMRGMGVPAGLLRPRIYAKWQPKLDAAYAKWQPKLDAADARWQAEYDAAYDRWKAEYEAVNAKWQPEYDAVNAKRQAELDAAYDRFWDLFAEPKNRRRVWR